MYPGRRPGVIVYYFQCDYSPLRCSAQLLRAPQGAYICILLGAVTSILCSQYPITTLTNLGPGTCKRVGRTRWLVQRGSALCSVLILRPSAPCFPPLAASDMQASGTSEPIVRIRDLKKNSVNFVLQNVDLAFVPTFSHPRKYATDGVTHTGSRTRSGES